MSDYIKREDAIKAVAEYTKDCFGIFEDAILNAEDVVLDSVPSADVIEPKRGKWIKRKRKCEYRCSECGKIVFADDENELNFCCSCGADMREREGE